MATLPRPTLAFLRADPAHLMALGFGSGMSPVAPGTFGTLFGWLAYNVLLVRLPAAAQLGIVAASFVAGIWACGRAGRALGVADHGGIVWDEIVAIWLVLALLPTGFWWQAAGFAAFRVFDIVKIPPASWVDAHMKTGFGVMLDDLIAAGYALLLVALGTRLWLG